MKRAPTLLLSLFLIAALPRCDALDRSLRREQEEAAELERLRAENRALEEEKRRLATQLQEREAKIDALLAQLAAARDEATRRALEKQLEAVRARSGKPACKCAPADPLCTCQ